MKRTISKLVILCVCVSLLISCKKEQVHESDYVNSFIGTGLEGRVAPVASVPFGMMQIGADTLSYGYG